PDERHAKVDAYLDANPTVEADLSGIRAPMTDFRNRCGLPPAGMPDA
ncbi:hemophore-related protein, partial [Enterococcus faecium]